ncbi:MAG: energy transducer TonB [Gammaproteobacteria bacterium]|nr:energy transducer TonB [Gammaproteobacteria bacterium]MBV9622165.1 energy transducer TonB [Gammaproteobacteria bacterium]
MAAYLEQDTGFFTRRGVVVCAILALHVIIAWALATGLAHRALEVIAPPIQTVIETETHKEAPPPPPPPPTFERPPVEIPPTDTIVELPVATTTTAITNVTTKPTPAAPRPPSSRTPARTGKNFPNSEDYYPAASKRLNEEGSSIVHVCVAPTGKLAEAPAIQTSSGSARLDEGALNLAKAGRYIAGTEDGKPVQDCFNFRVTFKMQK